ncbi:MAG TPA: hypothetical protein VN923_06690, partial [Thermoanaerobaculia bacterium]|nr:hypothetical protein [Thermoanaerobaculia bacterium]
SEIYFDDVSFYEGNCVPGLARLCLAGGRFEVIALWATAPTTRGSGIAVPLTDDSGSFWFFGPTNLEVFVKVLDACSFNQRFWVFASGATNVEVTLAVTDTARVTGKTYFNPLGRTFVTVTDTDAFATCP